MPPPHLPRLLDIIEAIERIDDLLSASSFDDFGAAWQQRWLVERGVEIISEASRHLSPELKARHPHIPWRNVAGIGNILRHNYESIATAVLWKLAKYDLPALEAVCRLELDTET